MSSSRFRLDPNPIAGAALVGGSAIASALVAGVQNFRAAQPARYEDMSWSQLVAAVRYSELMRARDQMMLGEEIQRLTVENARLQRDRAINKVRARPR